MYAQYIYWPPCVGVGMCVCACMEPVRGGKNTHVSVGGDLLLDLDETWTCITFSLPGRQKAVLM